MPELFSDIAESVVEATKAVTMPYRKQKRLVSDYKEVFRPEGKIKGAELRVLKDLSVFCGSYLTDYGSDPVTMERHIGRLEVLNWIKKHTFYKDEFRLDMQISELEEIMNDE